MSSLTTLLQSSPIAATAMIYIQTIGLVSVAILVTLGLREAWNIFFRFLNYSRALFKVENIPTEVKEETFLNMINPGTETFFGRLYEDFSHWNDVELHFDENDKPNYLMLPKGWSVDGVVGLVKLGQLGISTSEDSTITNAYAIFDEHKDLRMVTYRFTRGMVTGRFVKVVIDCFAPLNETTSNAI